MYESFVFTDDVSGFTVNIISAPNGALSNFTTVSDRWMRRRVYQIDIIEFAIFKYSANGFPKN